MINETSKQTYTTVGELIEELRKWDRDRLVAVQLNGITIDHPLFSLDCAHVERRPGLVIEIKDGEDPHERYLRLKGSVLGVPEGDDE